MSISPEHPQVVVAGQAQVAVLAGQLGAFVGVRAVAHEVAQEPHRLGVVVRPRLRARRERPAGCRARLKAPRFSEGHRYCPGPWEAIGARLPLTIVAAAVAAGAATLILRPRSGLIDPAAVDLDSLLQRRRAGPRRATSATSSASSGWAASPSPAGRWPCWRCARRARSAAAGARPAAPDPRRGRGGSRDRAGARGGGAAALDLASRAGGRRGPLHPVARPVARRRGQVRRDRGACSPPSGARWRSRSIRRFPRNWWLPGAGVVVGFAVLTLYLSPVVIDPLFNRFEPLPKRRAALGRAAAGRPGGRGRGGGLPSGRQPPHHGDQRVRGRPGAHQAGGALRQPDRRLPARTRCAASWRTSSAT